MIQPDQDVGDGIDLSSEDSGPQVIFPVLMGATQVYNQDWDYLSPQNAGDDALDPKDNASVDVEPALLTREEVVAAAYHPSGFVDVIENAPVVSKTTAVAPTLAAPSMVPTQSSGSTKLPPLPSSKKT